MILSRIKQHLDRLVREREEAKPICGLAHTEELIARIKSSRLTYLSEDRLAHISRTCQAIEASHLAGDFIEAGCALGGSAILISSVKTPSRRFAIYDIFGMIPAPSEEDPPEVHARYQTIVEGQSVGIGGDIYYGYRTDLYDAVQANLRTFGVDRSIHNVQLVRGLLQQTMEVKGPVALAHIDVDWYEPVRVCLQRIFPHLVVGGSIILDDYADWGGCTKATDEYLDTVRGQFEVDQSAGSLTITRIDRGDQSRG